MRVITGSAKGHGLKSPKHMKLRPTPSRVKEALFSSFAERIPGARVLELFAGTGAFSIEALSRGAAEAVLVEKDRQTISLIQENLRKTHLEHRAKLIQVDVQKAVLWLQEEKKVFNLIFADPPYDKGNRLSFKKPFLWVSFLLHSPFLPKLLASDGVLLIEHYKKDRKIDTPYFQLLRQFHFGDTVVSVFYHLKNESLK